MNNKELKNMFSEALSDFEDKEDRNEWLGIEQKLIRRNFFKFNAYRFNVYYACCVGFTFLLALGLGGHYLHHHVFSPERNQPQVVTLPIVEEKQHNTASVTSKDTSQLEKPVKRTKKVTYSHTKDEPSSSENNVNNHPDSSTKKEIPDDTSARTTTSSENVNHSSKDQDKTASIEKDKKDEPDTTKEDNDAQSATAKKDTAKTDPVVVRKKVVLVKQDTVYKHDTLEVK